MVPDPLSSHVILGFRHTRAHLSQFWYNYFHVRIDVPCLVLDQPAVFIIPRGDC